jgi:hypothetical protein
MFKYLISYFNPSKEPAPFEEVSEEGPPTVVLYQGIVYKVIYIHMNDHFRALSSLQEKDMGRIDKEKLMINDKLRVDDVCSRKVRGGGDMYIDDASLLYRHIQCVSHNLFMGYMDKSKNFKGPFINQIQTSLDALVKECREIKRNESYEEYLLEIAFKHDDKYLLVHIHVKEPRLKYIVQEM